MAESPVIDASSLVVLAKAELLDLLKLEGESALVPGAVAREIRAHSADAAIRALDSVPWLRTVTAPPTPPVIEAWDLGMGESAVLTWAHAHPGGIAPHAVALRPSGFRVEDASA